MARTLKRVLVHVVLIVFVLSAVLPFLWLLIGSLKTNVEVLTSPAFSLPPVPQWANYAHAWTLGGFRLYFKNSAAIAAVSDAAVLCLAAPAGFAFARRHFLGQRLLFGLIVMGMVLPPQIALTALFRLLKGLGVLDSYMALILPYTAFHLSLCVFVLRGYFAELPLELSEAAALDGASAWQVFFRVLLPLTRPMLVSLGVLNFIWMWNEFLFAVSFVYTNELKTIPAGLFSFVGREYSDLGAMAAGIVLSMIPVLVLYLAFQRQIVRGLISGALK
jgi:raffinose/stachyose/melibiose transport system permease protein